MSGYLKADMSKLSLAEAWRMGGWKYVRMVAGWKLRGERRYGKALIPATPTLVRVEPDAVDEAVRAAMAPGLGELQRAGFESLFWYTAAIQGPTFSVATVTINRAGDTLGSVTYVKYEARERAAFSLTSVPRPGAFLTTSNSGATFTPPPSVQALNRPGALAGEILSLHAQTFEEVAAPSGPDHGRRTVDPRPPDDAPRSARPARALRAGLTVDPAGSEPPGLTQAGLPITRRVLMRSPSSRTRCPG
jgi:hypothetical protein